MTDGMSAENLPEVLAALQKYQKKMMTAAEYGVMRVALAVQQQTQSNLRKQPVRKRSVDGSGKITYDPPQHIGAPGGFPNKISGDLGNSMQTRPVKGFGTYKAEVFPTMVYARAVELGGKNWQGKPWANGGYPYLRPSADQVRPRANRIFSIAFAEKLKRG
jgi:hypothetical protein